MKLLYPLILSAFFVVQTVSVGQEVQKNTKVKAFEKANEKYTNLGYLDAAKIYLKVAKTGFRSEELITKLANSFYFNSNYIEAVKWYKELYSFKKGKLSSISLLRYSEVLKSVGELSLSQKIYKKHLKVSKTKNTRILTLKDDLEIIKKNSGRYHIDALAINSESIDFGGFLQNDTLYFASTRSKRSTVRRTDAWTNQSFLDIYFSVKDNKNTYQNPKKWITTLDNQTHESSIVFTKDGNTMYFTKSNNSFKTAKKKKETKHLKIYRATRKGREWTAIEDLSINGDYFSTAHPALNQKEDRLYFVSNSPQSIGSTDIWYAAILKDGSLGKAVNLGDKVNTKGRESFPFITQKNELYFSSDRHFGLGGYDVFYFDLDSKDLQIVNVGKPINSIKDDFGFSINTKNKKGFFTSNRQGIDNIYRLSELKTIKTSLQGIVIDSVTNQPITASVIRLKNRDHVEIATLEADKRGQFSHKIYRFSHYTIQVEKEGYDTNEYLVDKRFTNPIVIPLSPKTKLKKGIDISKLLDIVISFDFDKYFIREDAKIEIEKIIIVLETYPKISINLKAHTDSQGDDNYNLILSDKRAKATRDYIISRGITPLRVTAKGYGETQLINNCTNNVRCSKKEHALNRRIEFIIIY